MTAGAQTRGGAQANVRRLRDGTLSPFGVRHRTAREAVVASQRGRLLEAIVKAVAAKGYEATTVADVVARAGVSRRTFYEQFRDKEACLLEAFEAGLAFLLGRIEQELAARTPATWEEHVRIRFETYLATLAVEPEFARVLHVDFPAAGARARARWAELLKSLVVLYRSLHGLARAAHPDTPDVSDAALLLLVGGFPAVVRQYLESDRVAELPSIAPQLSSLAIAILSGAAGAAAASTAQVSSA